MLLNALFIAASAWITAGKLRMGLWEQCIEVGPERIDCEKFETPGKWHTHIQKIVIDINFSITDASHSALSNHKIAATSTKKNGKLNLG